MKRVFIQARCKYPHGGALANYIQNLAKAISNAGYEVILAVDINLDYDLSEVICLNKSITIIPVMPSEDSIIRQRQRESGYCDERLGIIKKYQIDKNDRVIVLGLRNEYFLKQLFNYGKIVGFKTICAVLELFAPEDFNTKEEYERFIYAIGEVYTQSDAILSISEYIDNYFMKKGVRVFRLPPMVDSAEHEIKLKKVDKCRVIIPSQKDSFHFMLEAFEGLTDAEIEKIEIHLCGIKETFLEEIMKTSSWNRIKECTVVHPWMKYEELNELYQRMHFLLIARNECQRTKANFPSKVPEAMALGVVPIVSVVGDYTKYYLRDEIDSIFIDGDSVGEIKKSIRKAIYMSPEEYGSYSRNAYKTAKERFDYHAWALQINSMLEDV